MRRIPYEPMLLFPSFFLELNEESLACLWVKLREKDAGLPPFQQGDDAYTLLETLITRDTAKLHTLLFSLGLAAARMRGSRLPRGFEGNSSDLVVDKFCRRGEEALDEMCIQPIVPGTNDKIYAYDGSIASRLHLGPLDPPPDIPEKRRTYKPAYFFTDFLRSHLSGYSLTLTRKRGMCQVELYSPRNQIYIVFRPALLPKEADREVRRFCREAENAELDAEVREAKEMHTGAALAKRLEDLEGSRLNMERHQATWSRIDLFPLMVRLEPESFGEDEVLTGFDAGDIVDEIWLHRGLSMSRYEWQMVCHNFPKETFIRTGVMAERVMDEERPGEWCRVAPGSSMYSNELRNTPPKKFEHVEDAEIVEMRPEVFARGAFHVLLGAKTAEKMTPGDGMFWVEYRQTRYCLSLAATEAELIKQVMQLHSAIRSKVLIITAFLDLPAMRGVLSLRKICNPGSFREGLDNPDGFRQRGQAARKELDERLGASKWTREDVEGMEESALETNLARGYIAGTRRFLDMDLTKEQLVDAVMEARGEISRKARYLLDSASARGEAIIQELKNKEALQDMTAREIARLNEETLRYYAQSCGASGKARAATEMGKVELVRFVYKNRKGICAAAKKERFEREFKSMYDGGLVEEIKNWLMIKGAAVTPAVIVQEMGIPKAPEGAGWGNLQISLKIESGRVFFRFSYVGVKLARPLASTWLEHSSIKEFSKGEGELTAACGMLVKIITGPVPRKRGRPNRRSKRTTCGGDLGSGALGTKSKGALRQTRNKLGKILAQLTGLNPPEGGIIGRDGLPVFQVQYEQSHESDIRSGSTMEYNDNYQGGNGRVNTRTPRLDR